MHCFNEAFHVNTLNNNFNRIIINTTSNKSNKLKNIKHFFKMVKKVF